MAVFSVQCSVFSFQEAVNRKETQERKGAAATTTTVFTTTTQRHKDTTTERRLATEVGKKATRGYDDHDGIYHPDHGYLSRCHRDKLGHNGTNGLNHEKL